LAARLVAIDVDTAPPVPSAHEQLKVVPAPVVPFRRSITPRPFLTNSKPRAAFNGVLGIEQVSAAAEIPFLAIRAFKPAVARPI
jgi:hypothetical protein